MFIFLTYIALLIPTTIAVWELKKRKPEIGNREFWIFISLTIAATVISIYTLFKTNEESQERDFQLAQNFKTIKEKDDSIKFLLDKNVKNIIDNFNGEKSIPCMVLGNHFKNANQTGQLFFINNGEGAAFDVSVSFYDTYEMLKRGKEKIETSYTYNIGTIPARTSINGPICNLDKRTGANFYITFTTRKGTLLQFLELKFKNNQWHQAYQITDIASRKVYTTVPADFPIDEDDHFVKSWKKRKSVEDLEVKTITDKDLQ